jgi:UDP-N-acetylmuramoyl-L-alanyl-D-glutamate--2,6-diaminopimelate ligase
MERRPVFPSLANRAEVPMRLDQLLHDAGIGYRSEARPDLEVSGIADDSRRVTPGDLFIARPGATTDGLQFIEAAVARGAVAVVSQKLLSRDVGVPRIAVSEIVEATAKIAHAYYGHPAQNLKLLAVTGTNGKTTTAYLIRHLLNQFGIKCGLFGTVEIDNGESCVESDNTTPGAIDLARHLAAMRDHGCQAVALEASSHALDQGRLSCLPIHGAGFTNLSGDHLDYHHTMDDYAAAKARLFEKLSPDAVAVVNADDPAAGRMTRDTKARIVRYTIEAATLGQKPADYHATDIHIDALGTRFDLVSPSGIQPVMMPLIGRHNIQNALTAVGLVMETFGLRADQVAPALKDATGAPGRLQRVDNRTRPRVSILVDYAHTDDALENVLKALRPLTRGKLRVVFGCGGDRDPQKRPRMARIARLLGDAVYVTSDNPRTEDPDKIIGDILSGLRADERSSVVVEPDRRRAIYRAIEEASEEDVVLIAGKGHEKYQIVGATKQHFDDVKEAQKV